jgi:hypothetical protein
MSVDYRFVREEMMEGYEILIFIDRGAVPHIGIEDVEEYKRALDGVIKVIQSIEEKTDWEKYEEKLLPKLPFHDTSLE